MMGLTDTVYNLSWLITTVLQMTIVSILITLVTGGTVFEHSNKVFVFIYFELFSLAVINMCFLLAAFFSRSKTASLLGPMIFFASFFPYYAGNYRSVSTAICFISNFYPSCSKWSAIRYFLKNRSLSFGPCMLCVRRECVC